ncbi:hypothetical protein BMR07_01095 [Methylococcaceae bacterium CS1]|nr:hypothetical protein BMR10_11535 [Methylococcaceae bacterium CS4]TXL01329.1 hypothetical protein BMR11_00485 [Methylococcaceae bacterium CS5]TXL08957.1 hypothetical protein BMR07_01095 [Methylococcaceae bacterium CS1]TXL09219.1 hypothetical protein BMR09_01365 [Methylococcaceae bacterium CS3]TXL11865.1 hypothetical protein BMR08_01915 [Methylococcaceae bacterium CS2]
MKWSLALYVAILISFSGCHNFHFPPGHSVEKEEKIDQLSQYGAKFAFEYSDAEQEVCTKYTQLYQEGDWRAGWVLALQVTEIKSQHCLSSEEAIQILTTLESEKKSTLNYCGCHRCI